MLVKDRQTGRQAERTLTDHNHEMFAALAEEVIEELPQDGHGQVFEGPGAAMEQLKDVETP